MCATTRLPHRIDFTNVNILTVDLEDWFHICEVEHLLPRGDWERLPSTVVMETGKLLELLKMFEVRATFFVLGYVAEKHPELVVRIHGQGHEIGYHGWDHELVYRLAPAEFRHILRRGVECLTSITGVRPMDFALPNGPSTISILGPRKCLRNKVSNMIPAGRRLDSSVMSPTRGNLTLSVVLPGCCGSCPPRCCEAPGATTRQVAVGGFVACPTG